MTGEVAKISQRQPAEVPQNEPATSVKGAVSEIMEGLKQAVSAMDCDDLTVELSAHSEGDRSSAHFRVRAYRNNKTIVKKEG
jgi:hypothetical protein